VAHVELPTNFVERSVSSGPSERHEHEALVKPPSKASASSAFAEQNADAAAAPPCAGQGIGPAIQLAGHRRRSPPRRVHRDDEARARHDMPARLGGGTGFVLVERSNARIP